MSYFSKGPWIWGGNNSVGRVSDWKASCNTDMGSARDFSVSVWTPTPCCGKVGKARLYSTDCSSLEREKKLLSYSVKPQHYEHYGVSISHQTDIDSMTDHRIFNGHMLSFCMCIHTQGGTLVYSLIWKTYPNEIMKTWKTKMGMHYFQFTFLYPPPPPPMHCENVGKARLYSA